jgi:hypothetical protein
MTLERQLRVEEPPCNRERFRVSVLARIESALARAGLLFLEPGDTRTGGRVVRFAQ